MKMQVGVLILCAALCGTAWTQTTRFFNEYDHRVTASSAGDVNGDGIPDYLISIQAPHGVVSTGLLEVRSGANGAILLLIPVTNENFTFIQNGPIVAAAGDVNSDGFDDIITGHPGDDTFQFDAGSATVFSGNDGSVLYVIQGLDAYANAGISVAGLGDLNGDGYDDFAVGEPQLSSSIGGGLVRVFSGIDGSTMLSVTGSSNDHLGFSIANAHDLNNDGVNDFIVGQPDYIFPAMVQKRGRARVFSGADGSHLLDINGDTDLGQTGYSVGGLGDVDGDGINDLAVGEPNRYSAATGFYGRIRVVSGANGSLIHVADTTMSQGRLGQQIIGIDDLSGDGIPDFAAPAGNGMNAEVRLFSGADGSVFKTFPRGSATDYMRICDLGDINNDGVSDVIVVSNPTNPAGSPHNLNGAKTHVRVYESGDLPIKTYVSSSGGVPPLTLNWIPEFGNVHDTAGALACSGATPDAFGIVAASLAPADIPVFGTHLLIAVDPINLVVQATLSADLSGTFAITGITRRNPAIAGAHLFVQLYETSPTIRASNGLRFVIIP